MIIEEASELIKAICKFKRNGGYVGEELFSEVADVEIMLEQFRYMFKCDKQINRIKENKLKYLEEEIGKYKRLFKDDKEC